MKATASRRHADAQVRGFTLVEILVSTAILAILMLVSVSALDQMSRSWRYSKGKVEQFREARVAFELITRNLSQATLNSYWDYYYKETQSNEPPPNISAAPLAYVRQSELRFRADASLKLLGSSATPATHPGHAVFFQAPLGLSQSAPGLGNLLNGRGYYVKFGDDSANRPPFINDGGVPLRHRYRLMEYRPQSEKGSDTIGAHPGDTIYSNPDSWFLDDLEKSSHAVAENILLLIISPRVSDEAAKSTQKDPWWLAPYYAYNSLDTDNSSPQVDRISASATKADQGTQHLLPPILQVTMVAVDEASAEQWTQKHADQPVDILSESGAAFTTVSSYDADLRRLKDYLTDQKLNHRVFTASVQMRNARWDGRKL